MKKHFILIIFLMFSVLNLFSQDLQGTTIKEETTNKKPFSFSFIMGMIKEGVKVGNQLSNNQSPRVLFCNPNEKLSNKVIHIGGVFEQSYQDYLDRPCKKKYYEAYYHGKQFYIDVNDVYLNDEMKLRLDTLASMSIDIRKQFLYDAKEFALYMHMKNIEEGLDYLKKHSSQGLSIQTWSIYDESEYTDGTSFEIKLINPTKKTIKYITINIVGYNPVKDRVLSKGKYTQSVKCVGPIKPDELGIYSFEYVWFTDLVETAKITSIVVQYMDGTVKTINNVKAITWDSNVYEYMNADYPDLDNIKN